MKSKTLFAIRAAVTIVLMAILIYMVRDSIPKMISALKGLSVFVFLAGVFLFFLSIAIVSFRLRILLDTQNILLSIPHITKLTYLSYFFSSFLPTSVGGDVVKAFYIAKASSDAMRSYTSVFLDRFIGMFTIFLIATGALFLSQEMPETHFEWLLPLFLITSVLVLVVLSNKKLAKAFTSIFMPLTPAKAKEKIKDIYNAMHDFSRYKLSIAVCILISIAAQVTAYSATYFFALGLNSYLPLKIILIAMSVASVVSMLPVIYGTGPREMSIVIMLSPFIGKDKALAIAFLWLGVLLAAALIGGIIYVFTKEYKIAPGSVTAANNRHQV